MFTQYLEIKYMGTIMVEKLLYMTMTHIIYELMTFCIKIV